VTTESRGTASVDDRLAVLASSVIRLREAVATLDAAQLRTRSYADAWTIAEVLSHIGSGAVILRRRVVDARAGGTTPDDFAPTVWDDWNAKTPEAQAADALVEDQALVDTIVGIDATQRAELTFPLGPLNLDLAGLIGLRVNEHVVHSWDVEVALDPTATLAADATSAIVDNLTMIAGFAGKTDGDARVVTVRTTDPERFFTLDVRHDRISLGPLPLVEAPDLVIPAEAFVRLVYGRMDSEHTPPLDTRVDVDALRRLFPGI
jgi:uncharacterized protein (TIGR03083 family)